MGELTRIFAMPEADLLKNSVRTQMASLESLVAYLEDRGVLGAKEYVYCHAKLHEIVKHLKRLEQLACPGQDSA